MKLTRSETFKKLMRQKKIVKGISSLKRERERWIGAKEQMEQVRKKKVLICMRIFHDWRQMVQLSTLTLLPIFYPPSLSLPYSLPFYASLSFFTPNTQTLYDPLARILSLSCTRTYIPTFSI